MPANPEPLFFVHIPKTAGTSFREAAINRWGSLRVWTDYGNTRHSTEAVQTLVHQQPDYFAFRQQMLESKVRMLSGHAPVRFYRRIFQAGSLITFLRHPIDRTISHYYTACSRQGFKGSFEAFCNIPEHQNVQTRYLEQMPLEALGFVGITEKYTESIQIFNKSFSEKLRVLSLNQYAGPQSRRNSAALSTDDIAKAKEINQLDLTLYGIAEAMFETRSQLVQQGKPYTHGKIQQLTPRRLEGWAIDFASEQPVDVDIYLNGRFLRSKRACEYVPSMKERNIGRSGYVGFVHTFAEPLTRDDTIEVRVGLSGQILRGPSKPAEVTKPVATDDEFVVALSKTEKDFHPVRIKLPVGRAANE